MAETVRIEIPIETIDETEPELSNLVKKLAKMGETADEAGKSAQEAGKKVSKFDESAEKTQRTLSKWMKEKYELLLEAKDKVSPLLSVLGNRIKGFAGKTWSVSIKAVDLVTSPVRGIINMLKNPVFQAGAVLGVSVGLADTVNTYKDFEAAMSQVHAISGATSSELSQLTAKAKDMGATTKFTAEESAEAFNYMAMAGWKTDDMLGGIEGILNLAAASGEDLATTSDIVTDALTAFGMKASESGHFADVLAQASSNANTNVSLMGESFKYVAPVAGAMKYSVEDVSLALGLMANSSVKGSMAGTALKTSLANMAAPTDKMAEAMDKYGISLTDSYGNMKALKVVLDNMRSSLGGLSEAEQTAAASIIFGKEAMSGMLAIINASKEDYDKLAEAVNNADGAAKKMSETMLDNLQGSITLLQSSVDGVEISFGERLSPYIRSLADWLKDQMPEVEQGLDELMDWFDTKVDRMQRRFNEIADTKEWQEADFFGKVKIAWDKFIAEPFSNWWNSTGKAKFADFSQDIGEGIGSGLKVGIMTLLGIDLGETVNEGTSIGASFAKGFSEGFDFETVSDKLWQGFGNMLSNAEKFLPGGQSADLSSILSAIMLSKIASPFLSMGKGAFSVGKALFGTSGSGMSVLGSIIGSSGAGTGLLGFGANTAINLGAGNLAGGASLSTGALSAVGLGATAGGIAGAAGIIHGGIDLYKGYTTDDEKRAAAYKKAGIIEIGGTLAGAGAGAATGAAIGALFGGVGAVPGALIGAGVGAIGSWIAGNKVKKGYEEELKAAQEAAAKAQKVFEATGYSIKDVQFETEELSKMVEDTEVSAGDLAYAFNKVVDDRLVNRFGTISLSLEEIKKLSQDIVYGGSVDAMESFITAISATESSLSSYAAALQTLKKTNWMLSVAPNITDEDIQRYKSTVDDFAESSKQYIKDKHYEAAVALELLTGTSDSDLVSDVNTVYNDMLTQIEDLEKRLADRIEILTEGGVIKLSEDEEVMSLQEQIKDITDKLAQAENAAGFEALKIKYGGGDMDYESFSAFQSELANQTSDAEANYYEALQESLKALQLQGLSDEDYEAAVQELSNLYHARIDALTIRAEDVQLEAIADVFGSKLDSILPGIEGSVKDKLEIAMENALALHPDVKAWTPEEVTEWFDLDGLSAETQKELYKIFQATAFTIPNSAKEGFIQQVAASLPSVEDLISQLDWEALTEAEADILRGGSGQFYTSPGSGFSPQDSFLKGLDEDAAEERIEKYAQSIYDFWQEQLKNGSMSVNDINTYLEQFMLGGSNSGSGMAQYGPISNEYYEQILTEYKTFGTDWGNAMNAGVTDSLSSGSELYRSAAEEALNSAFANPFSVTAAISVMPSYSGLSGLTLPAPYIGRNAAGGYVSGGPQLSWLAEEGYGEFVIPTNPIRRSRALELYDQAGEALGVGAHAAGGFVRGYLNVKASDYNLRSIPLPYNETSEADDISNTPAYAPVAASIGQQGEGSSVQVIVQMTPEFIVQGSGQSEEGIIQVIKRHMREIADELGGEIASNLEEVFSNMPLKEA